MIRKLRMDTPTGGMTLVGHERALVGLVWDEGELARLGLSAAEPGTNAPLAAGARQLEEYFAGKRARFDLPLDPAGTAFQRAVWAQLERIPYGSTWSYRELAARVGNPGASRAVGAANGSNPLCIFIPCHRVVRASGELGGYAGGEERKAFLLELERRSTAKE
jgi:methylated-DNA-[protein]-cysteine S-methyltransferase